MDICKKFANDSVDKSLSHWQKRNPKLTREKAIEDILSGKVAEFGVKEYYENKGVFVLQDPDVEVYDQKDKTFFSDLVVIINTKEIPVAVKSQSKSMSDFLGEVSWTFQHRDTDGEKMGHNDREIFGDKQSSTPVVLCSVDGNKVTIHGEVPIKFLHENNLFMPPAKNGMVMSKKCVYLEFLKESLEKNSIGSV